MAPAVPFIAKMVISAVVSKVVTSITGNAMVGAIAGMGAGGLMSAGGGAAGAAAGTTASAPLANAGQVTYGGSQVLNMAPNATQLAGSFSPATVPLANATSTGLLSSAPAATGAVTPGGGGLLSSVSNMASKAGNWMNKNPELVKVGSQVLGGMAQAQEAEEQRDWKEEEEQKYRDWKERTDAESYEREHQTFDPNQVRNVSDVNQTLADSGYKSQYQTLMEQGPAEHKTGAVLPNYKRMLEEQRGNGNA